MLRCPREGCGGALAADEYHPEDGLTCLLCSRTFTQAGEPRPARVADFQPEVEPNVMHKRGEKRK